MADERDEIIRELVAALEGVCAPLDHMRKDAMAKGATGLGPMAYEIAHSLNYVQGIARAALERAKEQTP